MARHGNFFCAFAARRSLAYETLSTSNWRFFDENDQKFSLIVTGRYLLTWKFFRAFGACRSLAYETINIKLTKMTRNLASSLPTDMEFFFAWSRRLLSLLIISMAGTKMGPIWYYKNFSHIRCSVHCRATYKGTSGGTESRRARLSSGCAFSAAWGLSEESAQLWLWLVTLNDNDCLDWL